MSHFYRKLLTYCCLLFTGFCFLKSGAVLVSEDSAVGLTEVEAAVPARITQQRLQTTPIQKMRPGMRVLGRNPDRWDTQSAVEPDPVSWRLVSVRMEQQQPGQFVLGQLLRPLSWIRQNNALPSAVIQLEIPEMHVAGEAEVLSIADCPPIRRGPGSVVTGTFQHVSDEVISVFVEGESEPIGTTSQHPFWSRDRNAFVPAGELRIGEELKTALGTSTRVTSIEIRAGPETVYGLEVAGEHVYQITNAGLLVHNASGKSEQGATGPANVRVKTGESGELLSAFAKIERGNIGQGTAPNASSRAFVRRLGNATDDAGHAIGNNLGGLGDVLGRQVFPQSPHVNRGAFSQFEQQIVRRVEAGDTVFVRVVPRYQNGSTRPYEVLYQTRINGQTISRTFNNP